MLAALLTFWAAACGDDATAPLPPPPPPPVPSAVTVTPSAAMLAALGDTVRFAAEVRDRRGLLRDLPGSVRTLADAVAELGAGPNVEVLFSRGIPDVDREP